MNINPKAKRLLCYGDSYTWGYVPNTNHKRYPADKRWTGVLQQELGEGYEVIEEGLNSRTLVSDDKRPGKEGRSGKDYLIPCLDSHDPIDLVILMLGTNELKDSYGATAEEIGELLENEHVKAVLGRKSQFQDTYPKLLIVSPPIINVETEYAQARYSKAEEKNNMLANIYEEIANRNNCHFLNLSEIVQVGMDGVHINDENHKKLGITIATVVKNLKLQ